MNPRGVVPYVLIILAAILVSPWWLLVAVAWFLFIEVIL